MCIPLYISFNFVYDPVCVLRCTSLGIRWSYCVSLPVQVLLFIFRALLVCLLFNFNEKSYCDKTNLVLFAISVTIILVKQLQMIWDCITSFKGVNRLVNLLVYVFGRYGFHIMMVLCYQCIISGIVVVRERQEVEKGVVGIKHYGNTSI